MGTFIENQISNEKRRHIFQILIDTARCHRHSAQNVAPVISRVILELLCLISFHFVVCADHVHTCEQPMGRRTVGILAFICFESYETACLLNVVYEHTAKIRRSVYNAFTYVYLTHNLNRLSNLNKTA